MCWEVIVPAVAGFFGAKSSSDAAARAARTGAGASVEAARIEQETQMANLKAWQGAQEANKRAYEAYNKAYLAGQKESQAFNIEEQQAAREERMAAEKEAQEANIEAQKAAGGRAMELLQPFIGAGQQAIGQLSEESQGPLELSPYSQFRQQEALKAMGQAGAARGSFFSGRALQGAGDISAQISGEETQRRQNILQYLSGSGQTASQAGAGIMGQFVPRQPISGGAIQKQPIMPAVPFQQQAFQQQPITGGVLGAGQANVWGQTQQANIWGDYYQGLGNLWGQQQK